MASKATQNWKAAVVACGMPLTCGLEFHLQNRGINAILLDGKELDITKQYKRVFAGLVEMYIYNCNGACGNVIDSVDLTNPVRDKVNIVKIRINNGTPVDQKVAFRSMQYFGRMEFPSEVRIGDLGFDIEK